MLGQDKGALHEINDQLDIVRPVAEWCRRVLTVEDIPGAIHEAMRQMQTGRPRPTLVEVPPDVLATVADVTLPTPERYAALSPDQTNIQRAAALLATARKPLIWAGGGVIVGDAAASYKRSRKLWGLQSPRRRRARERSPKIMRWRSAWAIMGMARLLMPHHAPT